MAYIGMRKPFVAKYNRTTKAYSDGFQYAHAVSMSVTPNYAEASLYGDDQQVEYAKSMTSAAISLGTTDTPLVAASVVFGHTVDTSTKKVTFKSTDEANYVGVGVMGVEMVDGATKYVALIITCAKFADAADNLSTKGDSLTFNTPSIDGSAIANDDGQWKITQIFDTEAAAESFIKSYLNIQDPAPTTYTVTQTLSEHVTSSYTGQTATAGSTFTATLTAGEGYELDAVTVTMGGTDITSTAVTGGSISIAEVSGNIVITATEEQSQ